MNIYSLFDEIEYSELIEACYEGNDILVIKKLLTSENINEKDFSKYRTPLFYACSERGNLDIVKFLVENGALINVKDIYGKSPLTFAFINNKLDIAEYLISKGADISNLEEIILDIFNAGCVLYKEQDMVFEPVKYLLNKGSKINISLVDSCKKNNFLLSKFLIDNNINVNINEIDKEKKTALDYAFDNKNLQIVSLLIDNGIDTDRIDLHGNTVLMNICNIGTDIDHESFYIKDDDSKYSLELIEKIINNGSYMNLNIKNNQGKTVLMYACTYPYYELDARIHACTGARDCYGCRKPSSYSKCELTGSADIVGYLIDNGADINQKDYNGQTALMIACKTGLDSVIDELIASSNTSHINLTDNDGCTALHILCKFQPTSINIKTLLEHGANPKIKNKYGKTPIELFTIINNPKCNMNISALLAYGSPSEQLKNEFHPKIWEKILENSDKIFNEIRPGFILDCYMLMQKNENKNKKRKIDDSFFKDFYEHIDDANSILCDNIINYIIPPTSSVIATKNM